KGEAFMSGQPSDQPTAGRPDIPGYGLGDDSGLLPWSWAEQRLSDAHTYWLSTTRPDGRPHAMPVWGVWLDGRFYFSSGASSRKARNLASQPACVVSAGAGDVAVVLEGTAAREHDDALLERAAAAYTTKYDWPLRVREGGVYDDSGNGGPMFAVQPSVVFGFGDDFATATRWRFD
ncbi:MAG TPA: pyridoxamine 5'-phosphate oxidase family protein, partial [Dehalococcoidia bacterium]